MRSEKLKHGQITLVAGMGLLVPAWVGLLSSGGPTYYAPLPAATAFIALTTSSGLLAVVLVPFIFWAWTYGLFTGNEQVPKRSYALLIVTSLLSPVWFVDGWKYGLEYQGLTHVLFMTVINALCITLLVISFAMLRAKPSFQANLVAHWCLFAWLCWFAFPWLGELP